ncbi:helix-turn-helix domain-containing protein [Clostridium perfringens]|uniref:helix-turn-helix domain-containing protein n=1 Tax=Clostridium perfringens TaxID=1502 RepID=UPI00396B3906
MKRSYFWTKIKKTKLMSGYTQDELSKLIELSRLYINNLEAKTETHLTKAKLIKLNYYLDLLYLFTYKWSFMLFLC